MKLELEKAFPVPAGADACWAFLQDIEGVAGCMPGAKITERIDERHYKGTVSVKVGPASLAFRGDIHVVEVDAPTRTVHLVGKGADTTGSSGASMDLIARIESGADAASSNLVGRSELTVSGKAAAFGGRMMGSVTEQILRQFAANFAAGVQQSQAASAAAADVAAATSATAPAPAIPAAPRGNELNALALFWAVVRDWFRNLFRSTG
jgi:carbon monoxide dehydrogenase subunit G